MSKSKHHLPEIRFEMIGRQKLRTALWRSEALEPKTPLLFFNGIGANLEIAQPLGDMLRDRDVITFDMPGVGGSPDPKAPYRHWWAARAAKTILKRNGYDMVDVMGVSWGGAMAQAFAIQYRRRVNRLVLAATSPGSVMVPGEIASISKMAHPMRYTDQDFLIKHFETLYGDEPDGAHQFAEHMKPPSVRGYFGQLGAFAGWTSLPFLPFLPHETLILAGDRDRIVPLANARILSFMIPQSRLHIIEGGGHLFLLSRAGEVLPVMTEFLDAPAFDRSVVLTPQPAL
ncbi:MAG: alpha/beta fold hydrolase [Pseudomonadota bacterium]